MKSNKGIIKAAGLLAAVSLLLFPIAGCGPLFEFTGMDLLAQKEVGIVYKPVFGVAILCGVAIVFLKEKMQTFIASVLGLTVLIGLYAYTKMKMKPSGGDATSDNLNLAAMASSAIELKMGSYLAVISFIAAAVVSKLKNEIIPGTETPPSVPPPPTAQGPAPDTTKTGEGEENPV